MQVKQLSIPKVNRLQNHYRTEEDEIYVERFSLEHLDLVCQMANETDYIAANTRMVYYLFASLHSKFSFVALQNDEVVGFVLSMTGEDGKTLWFHQIGVKSTFKRRGIAGMLMKRLMNDVALHEEIECQLAIKTDNQASVKLATKCGLSFSHFDENIQMNIFKYKSEKLKINETSSIRFLNSKRFNAVNSN